MQPQSQLLNSAIVAKAMKENTSRNGSGYIQINLIKQAVGWIWPGGCTQSTDTWQKSFFHADSVHRLPHLPLYHLGFLAGHQAEPPLSAKHQAPSPSFSATAVFRGNSIQADEPPNTLASLS